MFGALYMYISGRESKPWGRFFQILCASQKVGTLQAPVILHFEGLVFRNSEYEKEFAKKFIPKSQIQCQCCPGFFFFESEFMYPKISLHVLKHNSWRSLDHRKLGLPPLQPDARCNIEYRWMHIPSFIQSKMFVYTRWFFFVGGLFRVGGLFKTYWQGCNFLVDLTAFDVATQFISQASYS